MLIHPRRSDLQSDPTARRGSDRVDAARSAEFWDVPEETAPSLWSRIKSICPKFQEAFAQFMRMVGK